jgi:hypothetical protein
VRLRIEAFNTFSRRERGLKVLNPGNVRIDRQFLQSVNHSLNLEILRFGLELSLKSVCKFADILLQILEEKGHAEGEFFFGRQMIALPCRPLPALEVLAEPCQGFTAVSLRVPGHFINPGSVPN